MKSERIFLRSFGDGARSRRLRSGSNSAEPNANDFNASATASASGSAAGRSTAAAHATNVAARAADDGILHAAPATRTAADSASATAE